MCLINASLLLLLSCAEPKSGGGTTGADDTAVLDTGDTGESGDSGETADTGDTGDTGDSGDTGDTGDSGVIDADGDGSPADTDCDDDDATVYPGAEEICGDGVVNDCDATNRDAAEDCEGTDTLSSALATWDYGSEVTDHFRASAIGDIDGDGYDDFAFGWPSMYIAEGSRASAGPWSVGGVFVYRGPVSGDHVQGDEDIYFRSDKEWDCIGWDIAPLGDVDDDGYDDFAVGAADPTPSGG